MLLLSALCKGHGSGAHNTDGRKTKLGHGAIWFCNVKQLHGAGELTGTSQLSTSGEKLIFPPFVFFLLFFLSQGLSLAPGQHFCGRRMLEQGLALMGRGCTDALPTSRTGGTSKLLCGQGSSHLPSASWMGPASRLAACELS